jgi:hypothetical protein
MRYSALSSIYGRLLIALCASIGITDFAHGQEAEADLVYKFSLQGIVDPVAAKPVQYALMEQPGITFCNFIDECDCFKLGSSTPLDYATLKDLLHDQGYELIGEVLASDGTVLTPPSATQEQK